MSKRNFTRRYNTWRYEVLDGHDVLYMCDHHKQVCYEFANCKRATIDFRNDPEYAGRTSQDYVEETLLNNGWKRLRGVMDSMNYANTQES